MSPAGYWPQLRAAIEAGADALYFGLKHFTARAKVGFEVAELPEVMRTLHARGVRGFVTFNTLVFEHELAEAARAIAAIAEAGADALIVQDLGVTKLARAIAPGIEIHASTQMSVTNAAGVRLAQSLGADRVTLARELSLDEIRAIRAQTSCGLEMFVHGALCVAYSGQCFSSEAWGGRSANRGQCAQACRLPYAMVVDDAVRPLGDARYLLSPGDLYTLQQIPAIVELGVAALKIEGRYKGADYVALTTAAYRRAVDEAWAGRPHAVSGEEELRLEQVYSRGLGPYFVTGTNHQAVVRGRAPRHRGVLMGRVARVNGDRVWVAPGEAHEIAPLKAGDGVVFDAADRRSPEEREEGGRVHAVEGAPGGLIVLRFGVGAIDASRIAAGDRLWRTHDPAVERLTSVYTEARAPVRKQPLVVRVRAHAGEPLVTEWFLAADPQVRVSVQRDAVLERAANRASDAETVRAQLARLGNTPYELARLDADIEGEPFIAASVLNAIRREAVEGLQTLQVRRVADVNDPLAALSGALKKRSQPPPEKPRMAELHLLVRTPEQLHAALAAAPASITLDYLDLYGLRPSVERVKAAGVPVRVASPRVLKPGEERIVDFLVRLDCGILVRSAGLLHTLAGSGRTLTGDFSLNAANSLTADMVLAMGIDRITPTHDLNAAQIAALAEGVGSERIEVIAYQHLPVFHTEHCVFCRFLSTGTSYRDCGRPCEKHRVALRDGSGREHPVLADVGCRNTVFGAEAQEASAHLDAWMRAGIRHLRLEFAHEAGEDVRRITTAFQDVLARGVSARELGRRLKQIAAQGVTQGSLFVPKDYLTLPVLQ